MLLTNLQESFFQFLLDPKNRPYLAVIKGLRNGLVFGTKIRFSHAFVMAMLFHDGTFRQKMNWVVTATKTHAKNLGLYVTIYKTTMLVLSLLSGGKEHSADPFIAGLLGGYIVFRRNNSINQQIVLYVFARNMLALAKLPVHKDLLPAKEQVKYHAWPLFASLTWGTVMWLFKYYPELVQPSMRKSMVYLYTRADTWDRFRNFLWHNQ